MPAKGAFGHGFDMIVARLAKLFVCKQKAQAMRLPAIVLCLAALVLPAGAAELTSEYTKFDSEKDCQVIDTAEDEDWSDLVCPGFGHYPFYIAYGDGRENITYGFSGDLGMSGFWPFNYANDTIEWRVERNGNAARPWAAIQRWFIADNEGNWKHQVLVVSRVGQPGGEDGGACVMAYVSAADGEAANVRAREFADKAAAYDCGNDAVVIEEAVQAFLPQGE